MLAKQSGLHERALQLVPSPPAITVTFCLEGHDDTGEEPCAAADNHWTEQVIALALCENVRGTVVRPVFVANGEIWVAGSPDFNTEYDGVHWYL